jgi:opacity protein-like surface antigen
MTKILLALALAVACSTSVLAAQAKPQAQSGGPYVYGTADEKLIGRGAHVPHSKQLKDALGGWNRGDPNDPYWDPCISYQRNWGPGACGGF